jgi:hypothetical protein
LKSKGRRESGKFGADIGTPFYRCRFRIKTIKFVFMKKTFLFITFIALCVRANSQSLTFNDLLSMMKTSDPGQFLVSKGFKLDKDQQKIQFFSKYPNSPKSEQVTVDKKYKTPSYSTNDTTSIKDMIKQVEKSYHLMLKDFGKNGDFYQFNDDIINIMFDIRHRDGGFGHVSISPAGAR